MDKEISYYRTNSGIADTKLSLRDYQYAYFKTASGLANNLSFNDYKKSFYTTQTGLANLEDAEYAYFKNAVSSTTTVRTNLVTNPSFEINTAGWSDSTLNGTFARVGSPTARSGSYSLRVGNYNDYDPDGSWSETYFPRTNAIVIGNTYKAAIYVRVDSGTGPYALQLSSFTPTTTIVTQTFTATTSWQLVETPTLTATGTNFGLRIYTPTIAPMFQTLYIDSAIVELSSTYTGYFDGNTTAAGGVTYAWTGTANSSTSTATSTTTDSNIAKNKSLLDLKKIFFDLQ
jgi:hypothetical protein